MAGQGNGMIASWLRYLLTAATTGSAAMLWLSVGPDASGFAHGLAAMASSAVAMLTTAVGMLVVSDWQVETQSRHDWAQLGPAPAELSLAIKPQPRMASTRAI